MKKEPNEYEVVFIDFDDTLCVRMVHEGNPEFYRKMFKKDPNYYLDTYTFEIGVGCRRLLESLKDSKVICLTYAESDIVREAKQHFLDARFPGKFDDMIIIGTREGKVRLMNQYADAFKLKHSDILLIDDHPDTRREAFNDGFGIMSASEMAILFD